MAADATYPTRTRPYATCALGAVDQTRRSRRGAHGRPQPADSTAVDLATMNRTGQALPCATERRPRPSRSRASRLWRTQHPELAHDTGSVTAGNPPTPRPPETTPGDPASMNPMPRAVGQGSQPNTSRTHVPGSVTYTLAQSGHGDHESGRRDPRPANSPVTGNRAAGPQTRRLGRQARREDQVVERWREPSRRPLVGGPAEGEQAATPVPKRHRDDVPSPTRLRVHRVVQLQPRLCRSDAESDTPPATTPAHSPPQLRPRRSEATPRRHAPPPGDHASTDPHPSFSHASPEATPRRHATPGDHAGTEPVRAVRRRRDAPRRRQMGGCAGALT